MSSVVQAQVLDNTAENCWPIIVLGSVVIQIYAVINSEILIWKVDGMISVCFSVKDYYC